MSAIVAIRPERPDRPAAMALLAELDRYLAGLYPPEANHILSVQALLAPGIRFLGAWQGERLVGCGAVRRMDAENETGDRAYGEVKRMYVHPDARGQRVGQRLLSALEDGLRADGITQALLETGELQTQALRAYERAGYARRGPFGGYPDNGLSVFMGKSL